MSGSGPGDSSAAGESVAERTQRRLVRSLADARPRTAEDAADPAVPVAATVILARDADGGPEVLLIERPERGSFAGAWVFPGGKVEDADVRGLPGAAADEEEVVARRAAVRETLEETGLVIAGEDLVTVSRWDPPPGVPLRIRTWFFLGRAPRAVLALQAEEAVAAQWARPVDVLARHGRGELTLYPPTWVTLAGLRDQPTVDALLAEARLAGVRDFATQVRPRGESAVFFWSEDAEYAADDLDAAATGPRHRLEVAALPWTYTRTP